MNLPPYKGCNMDEACPARQLPVPSRHERHPPVAGAAAALLERSVRFADA